ncbi:MAG: hypothetical protein L0Y72_31305 [Gemmataceae bacterium]|nr:hypothetical protein [Gemmataceae bacterium]MCI0743539.1 hypothetical protein [Gemmataceae bacterium]
MKIFDKPTQEMVDGPSGEGFDWAHALLTDCVFRLGVCFERLGKKQEALEMLRYFLRLRPTEKGSSYSLDDAAKKIAQLTSQTEKLSEMNRVLETVLSR